MENFYETLELTLIPRPQIKKIEEAWEQLDAEIRKLDRMTNARSKTKKKKIQELRAGLASMEMLDAAYEEAKENIKKKIESVLAYIPQVEGGIKEERLQKLAKDHKVTIDFILQEFPEIHILVAETKELKQPKCKNRIEGKTKGDLAVLGKNTLYEFLNYHGNAQSLSQLKMKESAELQTIIRDLMDEFDKMQASDERKSAGEKLAQVCKDIFSTQETKDDYDYYLDTYAPIADVLNKVGKLAENKTLLPQTGEVLVAELNQVVRNVEESRRYLRGKCKELAIEWTEAPDTSIANCIFCGAKIGVSDEVCGHCGKKQVVTCKKCGKKSRADSRYCTDCGQTFGDIRKASEYCDAAANEIGELNFKVAHHFLSKAEAEGGNEDKIRKVKMLLEKTEKEVGAQIQQLEECRTQKAYYQARQLLDDVKKMYPGYQNEMLETMIKDALAKAKPLFAQAAAAEKESECMELCDRIGTICSDYPGLEELKDKFPLETPIHVQVKIDDERKTNDILWEYQGVASAIRFDVVRKEHARPVNREDGELLGSFSARSCSDRTPEAGREYYYAVFACRGSKVSKPGYSEKEVVNLFEAEHVEVRPGDGVIQFQWNSPASGNVKLWRKENAVPAKAGDGIEIPNVTATGIWDSDVENGHSYGYLLCMEYKVAGKVLYSNGLRFGHIVPEVPPQAVTYLLSERNEGNKQQFSMEWDDDIKDTVRLYGSQMPLEWEEGTAIERGQLEAKAMLMNVTSREPGKGTLNIGNADEIYITAVTMGKESCVIGASTYISNKQMFKIIETRKVHGELHIFLNEWPKECQAMKVAYRKDSYPKSVHDKAAEGFLCTRSMYNQTKSIVVKQALPQDYYISVYGKLSGDRGYAPAVTAVFSNRQKSVISYRIVVKRGLMGKVKEVSLEFTSSAGEIRMPEMYVYKNAGFLPPDTSVGVRIREIEVSAEPAAKRKVVLSGDFCKNDYVRVFLTNSRDAAMFELNAVSDLCI